MSPVQTVCRYLIIGLLSMTAMGAYAIFSAKSVPQFSTLPEVRIFYNAFLDQKMGRDLSPEDSAITLTFEEIVGRVRAYRDVWNQDEQRVLAGMREALAIDFRNEVLEVHIIERTVSSFSSPIVISAYFTKAEFPVVLAHELMHTLLRNNKSYIDTDVVKSLMFPWEDSCTREHVIVFSTMSYVYVDVLQKQEEMVNERDISRYPKLLQPCYQRAWEIVDEQGYQKILSDFRSYYEVRSLVLPATTLY